MIVYDAPVSPDALSSFVREIPARRDLTFMNLFNTVLQDGNTFDWSEVTRRNRTARFRAFDGSVHVSDRDGGSDARVALPPLSSSLAQGEYERLQIEFAKTGGTREQALVRAIYNDGEQLTREVQNRLEQAIGQVLATAKLTIDENGLQSEADFGAAEATIVTAATAWTNTATAPVLDNLIAWRDALTDKGVGAPVAMFGARANLRLMLRNKQIIDAAVGSTSGKTRVTADEFWSLMDSEGLPGRWIDADGQVDVDGVATRVYPADRIGFLPQDPAELLQVRMGVSATALEMVGSEHSDMEFEDAPGIVGVVDKGAGVPYRQTAYVDAVGMPILIDARQLMSAKVR